MTVLPDPDRFAFRPLAPADLTMLHQWLQRPHVARWWSHPGTLADVEAEYRPVALGKTTTRAFIALLDGEPIGFIQSYVVQGSGDGWWAQETNPGARGIDQFLCRADQLNHGLGSAMVRCFTDRLLADLEVTTVQTDPSPDNERAIRSYRRAGFRDAGQVVTPDGPALLMTRSRSAESTDPLVDRDRD